MFSNLMNSGMNCIRCIMHTILYTMHSTYRFFIYIITLSITRTTHLKQIGRN